MKNNSTTWNFIFVLIVIYAVFSHLYFIFRFNGMWIEWDTGAWTKFIQAVFDEGTITPAKLTYTNGYGHQVISAFLLHLTNIPVQFLQSIVYPIIGTVSVLIIYPLFLEFTNDKRIALVSTFLLLLSPDFLFRTSRGSHEKFTFFLLLLTLYILARTFTLDRSRKDYSKNFMIHVLIFYIVIYPLITFNTFFASSYILAITFAFVFGYLLSAQFSIYTNFQRLIYTSATGIVFVFSNIFYVYSPAMTLFHYADTLREKISLMAFSLAEQTTPQYEYILYTWPSFYIWFFLTLFNWIIAPLSLIAWFKFIYDLIVKRKKLPQSLVLLLIFYTIFAIQLLIFIYTDRFGVFTHLELRIFPVLMFFAVPLAAIQIFKIIESPLLKNYKTLVKAGFLLLFIVLAGNSLLKATMEPHITNEWMFYTTHENTALDWSKMHLEEHSVWAGLDDRLEASFNLNSDVDEYNIINFGYLGTAEFYFMSSTIEKRLIQSKNPLPNLGNSSQIYDNGDVWIYKIERNESI